MKLAIVHRIILTCIMISSYPINGALLEKLPEADLWSEILLYCDGNNQFLVTYAHTIHPNQKLLEKIAMSFVCAQEKFIEESEIPYIMQRYFKRFDNVYQEILKKIFKSIKQNFKLHQYIDVLNVSDMKNFFHHISYDRSDKKNIDVILTHQDAQNIMKNFLILLMFQIRVFHYCLASNHNNYPVTSFLLQYKFFNYLFSGDRHFLKHGFLTLLYGINVLCIYLIFYSQQHTTSLGVVLSIASFLIIGIIMSVINSNYFGGLKKNQSLFYIYQLNEEIKLIKALRYYIRNKLLIENNHG